ncbi:MAG: DNA-processing protein DprA [Candidatus Zixiibacteriota bacterium]
MKDLFHWVGLSMAPGIGNILFKRLLQAFGSPEMVFKASSRELQRIEGIGPKAVEFLRRFDWKKRVEKELRSLEKIGGTLITWEDEQYPIHLKQIYDPPPLLYILGSLNPRDQLAVAEVGSRYPTTYGKYAAERIAQGLSRRGVTIVSGLARGVDSSAHRGALSAGGRTIGVLGCGIDIIYPPENRDLYDQVAAQGAVISEFPLGTSPDSDHFPIRNRIISGISLGVVVVEATLRSGSLITARFALEQGRDVYAVPGNVDSARSGGTNRLIKEGAKLVSRAEDILEELLPLFPPVPEKEIPQPKLSEEEEKVFSILEGKAMHIDQLISQSKLSSAKVSAILLSLELAGHIKQLPGMRFAKI